VLPDVVCLSSADWDAPLWTNKQHLMRRFGEAGARVLYVDSLGLRRPRLDATDSARIVRRLRAWRPFAREVAANVLRDTPLVVPLHGRPSIAALNSLLIRLRLDRNLARHRFRRPVLWTYVPMAAEVFDRDKYAALVYHCVDNLADYPGVDADAFTAAERLLVRQADIVIASSTALVDHLRSLGADDVVYWPNPADCASFAAVAEDPRRERRVAGFVGAIDTHKLDADLVAVVADRLPDWRIELVGPGELGRAMPPNVLSRGYVGRDELPDVVAGFSVGIIPYALTSYSRGVFPMKVFEYLAAGLPVVSTPLPSLVGQVDHVSFASDADGFARSIATAHESDTVARRAARTAYAAEFSWERRTSQALETLKGLPR